MWLSMNAVVNRCRCLYQAPTWNGPWLGPYALSVSEGGSGGGPAPTNCLHMPPTVSICHKLPQKWTHHARGSAL